MYIDFLILLIPIPLVSSLFYSSMPASLLFVHFLYKYYQEPLSTSGLKWYIIIIFYYVNYSTN